jgi:hypothetical protein
MRSLALLPLVALLAQPAGAATRNFTVRGFEKVRVEGPYSVRLKTGVAPFARATGTQSALDRIDIDQRGDTLVIHAGLTSRQPDKSALGMVEIELGTHDLEAVSVTGAGSLAIDRAKGLKFDVAVAGTGLVDIGDAKVDQMTVGLAGNANARIAGEAKMFTAGLRGMSSLDAGNLTIGDAKLSAEGPSSVRAIVTKSAKVDAKGAATFALSGKPSCTLNVVGSASVSGCK